MTKVKKIDVDKWAAEKSKILAELEGYDEVKRLQKEAGAALNKAVAIVDKLGISHYFPVSPLGQFYCADRESSKLFQEFKAELVGAKDSSTGNIIDEDGAEDILTECFEAFARGEYNESGGWEHSAVC